MSAATIEIGFDQGILRRAQQRLQRAMENPRDAWDEIGSHFISQVVANFRAGQEPGGKAWLASEAAKARKGKTLVHRGHLRNSYRYNAFTAGVVVGSNLVYAAIHHFGGLAGRKSAQFEMPARPALGVTPADEKEVLHIMAEHIAEAWGNG